MSKKKGDILIVDDNEEILFSLEVLLSKYFEKTTTLKSPNQIPHKLREKHYDVYILDMNFSAEISSGNEGFYWMREILKIDPDAVIIFITAFAGIELAVKAIKEGATDFIEKPWDNRKFVTTLINAFEIRKSKKQINELEGRQEIYFKENLKQDLFLCQSSVMKKIYATNEKIAKTDANVLILGENGTGKEVIAKQIHSLSDRYSKPFISVDMGALNENLIESELFGHIKGAFTDAREDRPGRFEIASGGTLFLDEIGNLPLHLQTKLLSVIQNQTVYRIGSNKPIQIDVRIISATNKPLYELAEDGEFREDLLYRINTVQVDIPPLRQRKRDIEMLSEFFLEKYKKKYDKMNLILTDGALKKIIGFEWPGNIRQLQHTIENTVILVENNNILPIDIQLRKSSKVKPTSAPQNFYDSEKELIKNTLEKNQGHLSKTAAELGIARSTLYRKISKYGL